MAKSPNQEDGPQHQYLVTWEPTKAQKWEIDLLTTHAMPYKIHRKKERKTLHKSLALVELRKIPGLSVNSQWITMPPAACSAVY